MLLCLGSKFRVSIHGKNKKESVTSVSSLESFLEGNTIERREDIDVKSNNLKYGMGENIYMISDSSSTKKVEDNPARRPKSNVAVFPPR